MTTLIGKIRRLSPRGLENLVYDLVARKGLTNVQWRTPGADGGRDIQGELTVQDFAGDVRHERWYVECKRYAVAVDWPTVFEKIPYACNHGSDYLLIATTSSLSPACLNEVAAWNTRNQRPIIRSWMGVDIARLVSRDALLLVRHGLSTIASERERAALPMLRVVSKLLQQIYGEESLKGTPTAAVEFATSAAEFVTNWLESGEGGNAAGARERFDVNRDSFPWMRCAAAPSRSWSPSALRAVLSAIRYYHRADAIDVSATAFDGRETLKIVPGTSIPSGSMRPVLNQICGMAGLEWSAMNGVITISSR